MKKSLAPHAPQNKQNLAGSPVNRFLAALFIKLGFLLLALLVVLLYGFILYEAWVLHSLGGILVLLILLGLAAGLLIEVRQSFQNPADQQSWREQLLAGLSLVIGALLTYQLSHTFGLGAVLASAITGLLGGMLLPRYGAPIYCGTFVGMCSAEVIFGGHDLLLASALAGGLFIISRQVLNGLGGKLGTIAFGGALLTGLGFKRQFLIGCIPPFQLAWQIVLAATLAALVTYWLSIRRKWGPVRASAFVGLVGGLLLPPLLPEHGSELAVVVICASFTGMSSAERLPMLSHIILAGLMTGIIFLYSMPVFGGAGGKLGTIAFGASLAVWGYASMLARYRKKRKPTDSKLDADQHISR